MDLKVLLRGRVRLIQCSMAKRNESTPIFPAGNDRPTWFAFGVRYFLLPRASAWSSRRGRSPGRDSQHACRPGVPSESRTTPSYFAGGVEGYFEISRQARTEKRRERSMSDPTPPFDCQVAGQPRGGEGSGARGGVRTASLASHNRRILGFAGGQGGGGNWSDCVR